MRCGLGGEGLGEVRPPAAEQLERDDGEPVAVARRGGRAANGLLGRHVAGGAEDRAHARQRDIARDPGDSEIGHADLAVGSEHQVRRLDVAVDDVRSMGSIERPPCLPEPRQGERRGNPVRAHPVGQRSTRKELHHDRGLTRDVGDIENGDDVRLDREPRGDPRLAREPRPDLGIAGEPLVQDLDRDPAVERVVGRRVDVGHAARRDQLGPAVARRERERACGHPPNVPSPPRRETDPGPAWRGGWHAGHQ